MKDADSISGTVMHYFNYDGSDGVTASQIKKNYQDIPVDILSRGVLADTFTINCKFF
jgi:hypothetical protein